MAKAHRTRIPQAPTGRSGPLRAAVSDALPAPNRLSWQPPGAQQYIRQRETEKMTEHNESWTETDALLADQDDLFMDVRTFAGLTEKMVIDGPMRQGHGDIPTWAADRLMTFSRAGMRLAEYGLAATEKLTEIVGSQKRRIEVLEAAARAAAVRAAVETGNGGKAATG